MNEREIVVKLTSTEVQLLIEAMEVSTEEGDDDEAALASRIIEKLENAERAP